MSRSKRDDNLINPAERFLDFAGGIGEVQFYDRESKTNIPVDLPFSFLVLDEVMTVGGGVDYDDGFMGYWSNAIRPRNAKIQALTVHSNYKKKSRVEMTGTWADIKAQLTGAKYIKGLYIAYYEDGDLHLGYLKVRGAALMPWVEFTKAHRDIYEGVFSITGTAAKKKGSNKYFEPVFAWSDKIKPETEEKAIALDEQLQVYLTDYFAQQGIAQEERAYSGEEDDYDTRQERAAIESEKAFNPRRYDPNDDPANPLNQGPDELQDVPEGLDEFEEGF